MGMNTFPRKEYILDVCLLCKVIKRCKALHLASHFMMAALKAFKAEEEIFVYLTI